MSATAPQIRDALIVRDARDWAAHHQHQLQQQIQVIDAQNIHHIDTCPGCPECDALMEFYSGCAICGRTAHMEAMHYDPETGEHTCEDCHDQPVNR